MNEGPSLTLEHDAGDVVAGTAFVLEGEQIVVGEAPGADGIVIRGAQLSRRHLRLTQQAGAWFVADMNPSVARGGGELIVTLVNGAVLDAEPRALHDGDRVFIRTGEIARAAGGVVLVFRDRGRLITAVTPYGARGSNAVVTFCPWHRHPSLAYAMREGQDRVYTAIEPSTQWFVATGLSHNDAHAYVGGVQIVDDLFGIFLGDVVRVSLEENGTIDVAILFEAARLASTVPSGVHLRNRALLTFSGAVVWFGDPLGEQSALLRQGLVHQLLVTLGCEPRVVGPSPKDTLAAQRDALAALPLDAAARRALLRVIGVAIEEPARICEALAEEAALGGAPSPDDVRGLLANLFPNEHARHGRVTEEAQLLGFDGVAALA